MAALDSLLRKMIEEGGSDLHLTVGLPPKIRNSGALVPLEDTPIDSAKMESLLKEICSPERWEDFLAHKDLDLAYEVEGLARFRGNYLYNHWGQAAVFRQIPAEILSFEKLNLPEALKKLCHLNEGLVVVTGPTGSGKSTTLAAMIGHRNRNSGSHILTIEDPLEFVHSHQRSIVQQREVGIDTLSYENALKNALREAPDVILIGEIRDMDTMKHAINYSETGHLCLATLHANNANQALDRIINFFPEMMHRQILMDLSLNLRAIISQRLLPSVQDGNLVPAVEVMLSSPYIAELINKGQIGAIKDAMKESSEPGTITFDQALLTLYREGKISQEDALRNADSRNDLSLEIRMGASHDDNDSEDELILS